MRPSPVVVVLILGGNREVTDNDHWESRTRIGVSRRKRTPPTGAGSLSLIRVRYHPRPLDNRTLSVHHSMHEIKHNYTRVIQIFPRARSWSRSSNGPDRRRWASRIAHGPAACGEQPQL